jgi:hypothetical protein
MVVGCEQFQYAFWGQPANSVTSLAFVLTGVAIVVAAALRRSDPPRRGQALHRLRATAGARVTFGVLVAAVGVGSFIQHGPHPQWQAYPHDLTLAAVLAFLAVDAAADLTGRRLPAVWWCVPALLVAPMIALGPAASTVAQASLGALAVGLNLLRAWRRPQARRRLMVGLGILAVGAVVGNLGDHTGLCQPESLWQGHAAWHALAALALWWVSPVVGTSGPGVRVAPQRADVAHTDRLWRD